MSVGKMILCFAFVMAMNVFLPVTAEEFRCPSSCSCSSGFLGVTCAGMTEFPDFPFAAHVKSLDLSDGHIMEIRKESLKRYENLQYLDLRGNKLRAIEPGLFTEMGTLRRLYIENNPWSCDTFSLEVLQNELIDLIEKNQNLDYFDGGKTECSTPPDMNGKKPLFYKNTAGAKVHFLVGTSKGSQGPTTPGRPSRRISGVTIAFVIINVLLFLAVVFSVIKLYGKKIMDWIRDLWKPGSTKNDMDKMEAGELETESLLIDSMKKRRRRSKGIPEAKANTSSSDEDDNTKQTRSSERPKPKAKKPRTGSGGLPRGVDSSEEKQRSASTVVNPIEDLQQQTGGLCEESFDADESGHSTVVDLEDYLKEKMNEQRQQSCRFTKGERSIAANESTLSTSFDLEHYLKYKMTEEKEQSCGFEDVNSSIEEEWKFTILDISLD